jgi:hypothetical protein
VAICVLEFITIRIDQSRETERLTSRLALPPPRALSLSLFSCLSFSVYVSFFSWARKDKVLYVLLTNEAIFSPHGSQKTHFSAIQREMVHQQKTHFSAQWSKKWRSKGKWYINRKMGSIQIGGRSTSRIFEDEHKNEGDDEMTLSVFHPSLLTSSSSPGAGRSRFLSSPGKNKISSAS